MGYYYFDPTYILVLICVVISMMASARVNSVFNKYNRVAAASGMTGAEAAKRILNAAGIYDVSVEHVRGNLSDHYDPRSKVLRLSDSTYGSRSVAAIGVAAHECGHAIQHQVGYAPLKLRSSLVPITNIASKAAIPMLRDQGILGSQEIPMSKRVLSAAAMTYVAAAASSIIQLLRLILLFGGRRRD